MTSRLRFFAPLLAALVLVAGCGSDDGSERASASTDPTELLRSTFANLGDLKSATVDLAVNVDAGDAGPINATLKGPFETQGKGKLPRFAFEVSASVAGQSLSAGAVWTGKTAYLSLMGTAYEVPGLVTSQFLAAYEEALKSQQGSGGPPLLGDLGIDFTTWLKDVRNEGVVEVGDAEAVKITGTADVARVVEDLNKLAAKAATLNVPGTGGSGPKQLTPEQKQEAIDAVKDLRIEVYSGTEDRMLRRLTVNADVEASGEPAKLALDLKLLDVGQGQDIEAPADAKSFDELTKSLEGLGLGLDGLSLFGSGGGSKAGEDGVFLDPGTEDSLNDYTACIEEAGGDTAKLQKCSEILIG